MSEIYNLQDYLSVDSRLTIGNKKLVEISRGPLDTTVVTTTANNVAQNQLTFNVQCSNNAHTIIDPYMYVEVNCTATINASGIMSGTVKDYLKNHLALRQYPLASITNTCQVQIDTQSESSNPCLWIHQLSSFQDFISGSGQAIMQSLAPVMPDQSPSYWDLIASMKNPLNGYVDGGSHYSEPRGSFNSLFEDVTDTASVWSFNFTLREPLFNPLLEYDAGKVREGLAYVNKFDVTLSFVGNINRMFSMAVDPSGGTLVTSLNVVINSGSLKQTWLTSPLTQSLPDLVIRSYNSIIANPTNQTSFTAGQTRNIQSQSFQVSQIPKKIWVYVVDAETDISTGYQKSDYSFAVDSITVLFNNRAGLMTTFSASDLYNACMAEEGSSFSFVQSRAWTGGVLCIDPSKLLGLRENESPGLLGNYQLQIQCTVKNISQVTVTPYLYVTWALDTIFTIDKNNVSNKIQGYITSEDVLSASNLPANPAKFSEDDIYGGVNWGKIWKGVKKAATNIHDAVKKGRYVSKALASIPQTARFAQPARDLGYGGRRTSRGELMERSMRY